VVAVTKLPSPRRPERPVKRARSLEVRPMPVLEQPALPSLLGCRPKGLSKARRGIYPIRDPNISSQASKQGRAEEVQRLRRLPTRLLCHLVPHRRSTPTPRDLPRP